MSIQSEINRINSAKADIGAAIAEKGTTVPDGTKIDGMATLIRSIQSGGGGYDNVFVATITPASNTLALNVSDVPFEPNVGMCVALAYCSNSYFASIASAYTIIDGLWNYANIGYKSSTSVKNVLSGYKTASGVECWSFAGGLCTIYASNYQGSNNFIAGVTYAVILGVF